MTNLVKVNPLEIINKNNMASKIVLSIFCFLLFVQVSHGQVTTKQIENFSVSSSKAILLGKSKPVKELAIKPTTSKIKKQNRKIEKKVPDNFKGRRNQSKAVHLEKEHQGPDPIRQSKITRRTDREIELLVNVQGLGLGSPSDPTGDVNSQYYVQGVNATDIGVYNLDGTLEMSFALNTIFDEFGVSSDGDPIILYDETSSRWILTEFTDPANVLIAVSESDDPLGSYFIYNFTTPNFPDYPKYALTPEFLFFTSNERGPSELHQYFLDKSALFAGSDEVDFQRVTIDGNPDTEAGFYVTTPVDWNGTNLPFDSRPITMRLNDSSWANGPEQDQIELYKFDIDFDNPSNISIEQTSIVTAPFDSYPCSESGPNFRCIPQFGGSGIDGVPELIMNLPHQRNFGSHESIVLSHITDVTDGDNFAGVRWVELRREANTDWTVYQQGTYAPDDGLERFMSTAAIDSKGNICLGYNVSSANSFVGLRATGRNAGDPLGEMTYTEIVLTEGQQRITSGGRFGDYSQMSVSPGGLSNFWFTAEYAGSNGTITNIAGMSLQRDTFDLTLSRFISPSSRTSRLTTSENVTIEIFNGGISTISAYDIALEFEGSQVDMISISEPIEPSETVEHTFSTNIDLSAIQDHALRAYVTAPLDQNPLNDTLRTTISNLPALEASLAGTLGIVGCDQEVTGTVSLTNLGDDIITSAIIGITVNGITQNNIEYSGSLSFEQSIEFSVFINQDLENGNNEIITKIISLNSTTEDFNLDNNEIFHNITLLDLSEFITISFLTDRFPSESSYTVVDANGFTILERDNFQDESTVHNEKLCVAEGDCFTLTLLDSEGDGICCDYGAGSISILDNTGEIMVFDQGQFGNSLTINFCNNPGECMLDANIEITQLTSSTSDDGAIMITALSGVGPFEYSINGGNSFQSENIFTNLSPDDYVVSIFDTATECIFSELVTIAFETSTYIVGNANVHVELIPNPTEGVFQIKVKDLPTSEKFLDIEIYDIQGKLIQDRKIGKWDNEFVGTFSLYAYPAGTYLVRVKSEDNNFLERIVKQ